MRQKNTYYKNYPVYDTNYSDIVIKYFFLRSVFSFTGHFVSVPCKWFIPILSCLQTLEFVLIWHLPEVWQWEQRPLFEITRSNGGQANRGSKHVFPGTEEEPLPLISTLLWTGWWTAACCFGSVFTLPQGYFCGREYSALGQRTSTSTGNFTK